MDATDAHKAAKSVFGKKRVTVARASRKLGGKIANSKAGQAVNAGAQKLGKSRAGAAVKGVAGKVAGSGFATLAGRVALGAGAALLSPGMLIGAAAVGAGALGYMAYSKHQQNKENQKGVEVTPADAKDKESADKIRKALEEKGIKDPKAQANILAQVKEESNFKPQTENLGKYTGKNLFDLYGPNQKQNKVRFKTLDEANALVKKGPDAVGDVIYGNRNGNSESGEGNKYRGRGFIQLTGKANYAKMGKAIGVDLVKDPDKASDPEIAAKITAEFYASKKGDLRDINTVNKMTGSADVKSKERRKSIAAGYEKSLSGGEPQVQKSPNEKTTVATVAKEDKVTEKVDQVTKSRDKGEKQVTVITAPKETPAPPPMISKSPQQRPGTTHDPRNTNSILQMLQYNDARKMF